MYRITIKAALLAFLWTACTTPGTGSPGGSDPSDPSSPDAGPGSNGDDRTGDDRGGGDPGGDTDGGTGSGGGSSVSSECDAQGEDLGSDMSLSMTVDTSGQSSDSNPSGDCAPACDGVDVPDKVFRYTPPADGLLSVSTRDGIDAIISILDSCEGVPFTLACNHGMQRAVTQVRANVPVYIAIDGCEAEDVGQVQMDINLVPDDSGGGHTTEAGDSCDSPPVLSFHDIGGGVMAATASGDTSGASNEFDPGDYFAGDHTASCPSEGAPDHYYAIDNQEAVFARFEVRPTDSSFDPLVYVFTDCVSSSMDDRNPKACSHADGGPGEAEIFNTVLLEQRTYFIGIDGVGGTSGSYELTVRLGE